MAATNKTDRAKFSAQEFIEAELTVQEAVELIAICREAFNSKLWEIERAIRLAISQAQKDALQKEAMILNEEYKKTLLEIEACIDEIATRYGAN